MSDRTAQRMVGGNTGNHEREKHDFYPTPQKTIEALLNREKFNYDVWECACGEGDISKVLEKNGYNVYSTDLIDRGFGIGNFDFLDNERILRENLSQKYDIVTNPPFKLSTKFILQAKSLARQKVAILGRINLLEGVERYNKIFKDENFKLARVHVFVKRQKFFQKNNTGNAGIICFAWFVWDKEHKGNPEITFLDI